MHLSASAIALRRLMSANALLLEIGHGPLRSTGISLGRPDGTISKVAFMARRTLVGHCSVDAVSYCE